MSARLALPPSDANRSTAVLATVRTTSSVGTATRERRSNSTRSGRRSWITARQRETTRSTPKRTTLSQGAGCRRCRALEESRGEIVGLCVVLGPRQERGGRRNTASHQSRSQSVTPGAGVATPILPERPGDPRLRRRARTSDCPRQRHAELVRAGAPQVAVPAEHPDASHQRATGSSIFPSHVSHDVPKSPGHTPANSGFGRGESLQVGYFRVRALVCGGGTSPEYGGSRATPY